MKISTLSILCLLLLGACTNKNEAEALFVKGKIDGKAFEASGLSTYATNTTDTYNIYAVIDAKRTLYLSIDKAKGVGTHKLTDLKNYGFYTDESGLAMRSDRTGASGEVQVTVKTATNVSGKFKCVVKDKNTNPTKTVTITDGEFSVQFR